MTEPARITVSEDKLDAKLSGLELRLVDRITQALDVKADQAYVEQLHARVHTAEASIQAFAMLIPSLQKTDEDVEGRLRGLERFRYAIPSAAVVAALAACASAFLIYLHG